MGHAYRHLPALSLPHSPGILQTVFLALHSTYHYTIHNNRTTLQHSSIAPHHITPRHTTHTTPHDAVATCLTSNPACPCSLGLGVARGLQAVHSQGLIVCSLQPATLFADGGALLLADLSAA